MNGNKMTRLLAVLICAFMLIQCTAIGALAADIAPEAVVYVRPEVTDAVANQVGMNYVYVDIVTENSDNDQTVMVYMVNAAGKLVTMGYSPIGDNKAEVKLGAPDSVNTGKYELVVALNKAADIFRSEVFYVGTTDVIGFFEAVNMTEGDVKAKLDAHYNALSVIEFDKDDEGNVILKLTGKDYEKLSANAKAAFAELILNGIDGEYLPGKGGYSAENSEDFIKEAYILAAYNTETTPDEDLVELLYKFETVVGFDADDENLYAKINDKDTFAKVIKTVCPTAENVDTLEAALEKAAAIQIVNETNWLNLVTVVKNNNDIFGVDESEIKLLENTKKLRNIFCEEFMGTYYSIEGIREAWEAAYDKAYDEYKDSLGGGGGGGSGSSSSSIGSVVKTAEVNTQISQSENQKDPNVEIKDYYTDISDSKYSWAADAVLNLTKNQIVSGYGDKTFGPEKSVTRAEFMKMVINALGLADVTATCSFTDVDSNAWYYIYVASAQKLGIAQGYGNGLFGVNDTVTRQDAITAIYRAAKIKGLSLDKFTASIETFKDRNEIASYAAEAVSALHGTGVYLDVTDPATGNASVNAFEPTKNASRAYLAVIIDQIYRYMK